MDRLRRRAMLKPGRVAMLPPASRWALILLLVATILAVSAPWARADGDPGSDVLVNQNLFLAADSGASVPAQLQLTTMLSSAASGGTPIRIAVIAHPDDLGAVTALWRRPQAYARFLGIELSLTYKGRLLVVMPDGLGFNWPGHPTAQIERALAGVRIGHGGAGLIAAAEAAATRIAATGGVKLATPSLASAGSAAATAHHTHAIATIVGHEPAAATRPAAGGASTGVLVALIVGAALAALAVALAMRRRDRRRLEAGEPSPAKRSRRWIPHPTRLSRRWAYLTAAAVGAAVIVFLVLVSPVIRPSGSTATALATNPYLDPGTTLGDTPAPDFTLYDQTGHPVSLRSFRGKVTLLAFNDSECTTICPLTTQAMLDAKRMLGAAGAQVQLLGIDANPKATQIEDVLSYTQLHGLVGKWDFLTGSITQLRQVWHAYGVEAEIRQGLISHTPALYVIDQRGRLRKLYMTQQSYASVGQFGQVLAHEVSSLLPSHPAVDSHLTYATAASTPPTHAATLPRSGGGTVKLGPGHAHLYLFFDTWDREVSSLGGELDRFNRYTTARGLPALTAIDEGSVEPSRRALPDFLHSLSSPLRFPVGVDTTGRVADGYQVQGVPWLVLTSAKGKILWYDEVIDAKWPSVKHVEHEVRAALHGSSHAATAGQADLIGSPRPLAAIHAQSGQLLGGGVSGLMARIKALRGYPVVVNVWASWCEPCQKEFGLLATASLQYGREVAFLGADTNDPDRSDAESFLRGHPVSYPSYTGHSDQLGSLLRGGLAGTPTTIFINRAGKVVHVQTGEYASQGTLDSDIKSYALTPGR